MSQSHPLGREFFLSQFLIPRDPYDFKLPWRLLLDQDPLDLAHELVGVGLLQWQENLCQCSHSGKLVAENFLRTQAEGRSAARQQVQVAFSAGDYDQAARTFLDFESLQPFPRDKALNPTEANLQALIEDLGQVARSSPARLNHPVTAMVRCATALAWLWGSDEQEAQSLEIAILGSYVANHRDLQRYTREGLTRIQILASRPEECCPNCLRLHEHFFEILSTPELPAVDCTNNPPCQCIYMPDLG
ncbi:hypothetical protein IV102_21360 [bacterium]|nr:hypothetical protein [bacterium]